MNASNQQIEICHPVLRMDFSEQTHGLYQMAENIADLLEVVTGSQSYEKDILTSSEECTNPNIR